MATCGVPTHFACTINKKILNRKEMIPMKKLLNKKGFTLMEMLIVVAIIVILVAISVPTFTANLDEAKSATDAANLRAAKSAAQIYMLNNEVDDATNDYFYSVDEGDIVTTAPTAYGECSEHSSAYIVVDYTGDTPDVKWSAGDNKCGD